MYFNVVEKLMINLFKKFSKKKLKSEKFPKISYKECNDKVWNR